MAGLKLPSERQYLAGLILPSAFAVRNSKRATVVITAAILHTPSAIYFKLVDAPWTLAKRACPWPWPCNVDVL